MKKKTNLQAVAEAKPHRGPQKEKTQVTIRIDQELMKVVYAQMKDDNTRITDIIERGLVLWLKERHHEMPEWTKQVRFVVANATREQERLIRGLLIAMVEPEVLGSYRKGTSTRPAKGVDVVASGVAMEAKKLYELVEWYLQSRNTQAHATECLRWYSRYGKSAEEVAQLEG